MSNLSIETLQEQLKKLEQDLEVSKAQLYRVDGAIQVIKQLISQLESPEVPNA